MAQDHVKYSLGPDEWTLVTDSDTSAIKFSVVGGGKVIVAAMASTTLPDNADYNYDRYTVGQGEIARNLTDLAPGVTSPVRVAMRAVGVEAQVVVSHA